MLVWVLPAPFLPQVSSSVAQSSGVLSSLATTPQGIFLVSVGSGVLLRYPLCFFLFCFFFFFFFFFSLLFLNAWCGG